MSWRPMQSRDLAAVAALANAIHLSYPEDPAVIRDRLAVYPEGCHVLDDGRQPRGYLLCHPWLRQRIPALNSMLGRLPDRPDCLYLHDLALDESVRGQGHALTAVEIALEQARSRGLPAVLLVAVGRAHAFWEHVGFRRSDEHEAEVSGKYGPEAAAYTLELPS
jgi:GNAT superfamily N-acetyltransferase